MNGATIYTPDHSGRPGSRLIRDPGREFVFYPVLVPAGIVPFTGILAGILATTFCNFGAILVVLFDENINFLSVISSSIHSTTREFALFYFTRFMG